MTDDIAQRREEFDAWLMHMDDALEAFFATLDDKTASALDYSLPSLDVLEGMLLERYPDAATARAAGDVDFIDGCARYLGETLCKLMGGQWQIVLDEPENVHFGLPRVAGSDVPAAPACPIQWCFACLDRRKGNFMSKIVRYNLEN